MPASRFSCFAKQRAAAANRQLTVVTESGRLLIFFEKTNCIRCQASNCRMTPQNLAPSGAAHIMPTSAFSSDGKYPWRTDVKAFPSREHRVSIESFFRTALHQMGAVSERPGMVDQSEKSRVNTTLA